MIRILFIDDDPNIHTVLQMSLPCECAVIPATNGEQGLKLAEEEDPDVVLLDIGLPDIDGIQVLRRIVSLPAAPPVFMVTASSEPERVVEAIKLGAHDYIVKPFTREKILAVISTAVRLQIGLGQPKDGSDLPHILGNSPAIRNVKHMIRLYATSTSPVLIVGETGTGKELVARTIHELSARQQEVYLPINCGAIPDTLMETELFGSERGAYTDAITRPGVFERANRGSLFLDEVGEMGLQHQVKLLRVIEDKSFTRVGGVHSVSSDARIIAATNRTLSSAVQNGTFRQDLYYRINTLPLSVPPLRRRKMDIPELARNFVRLYTGNGGGHAVISSSAIEKLVEYRWPGNIRELKNVIERALLFAENGRIDTRHVTFG